MVKLFCQTCGNIYIQKDKNLISKCPRCGSIAYSSYAAAVHRYFRCNKCKITFKLSEVAARHFSRYKDRPKCPRCKGEIISISTERNYKKDSGQQQKKNEDKNNSLNKFGLKTW